MKISEIFNRNVKEAELLDAKNFDFPDEQIGVRDPKGLAEARNEDPAMQILQKHFGVLPHRSSRGGGLTRYFFPADNRFGLPIPPSPSDESIAGAAVLRKVTRSIGEVVDPGMSNLDACSCDRIMDAKPSEELLKQFSNIPLVHFTAMGPNEQTTTKAITGPNGTFQVPYTEEGLKKGHELAGTEFDIRNYPTRHQLVHRHVLNTLFDAMDTLATDPSNTECRRIIDEFSSGSSALEKHGVFSTADPNKQANHNFLSHVLRHTQAAGWDPEDVGLTREEADRFKFSQDFLSKKAVEKSQTNSQSNRLNDLLGSEDSEEAYRENRIEEPSDCRVCEQYRQRYNGQLIDLKKKIANRILTSGKPYSPEYAEAAAGELAHHVHNMWTGSSPNEAVESELYQHHAKDIEGLHDVLSDWDDHRDAQHDGAKLNAVYTHDVPIIYDKPEPKLRDIIDEATGEAYEPEETETPRNPAIESVYRDAMGIRGGWDINLRKDIHTGEDPFLDEEGRPVTQMRGESDDAFAARRQQKANEAGIDITMGARPSILRSNPVVIRRPDYIDVEPPRDLDAEGLQEWEQRRKNYEQSVPAMQVAEQTFEPRARLNVEMPGANYEGSIEGLDENGRPIPLNQTSNVAITPNMSERVWTRSSRIEDLPGSVVVAPMENFKTTKCRHKDCENPETCSGNHEVKWKVPYLPNTEEVRRLQQRTPYPDRRELGITRDDNETEENYNRRVEKVYRAKLEERDRAELDRKAALSSHYQYKDGVTTANFRSSRCERCGSQLCDGWHKADDQSIMSLPSEHAYLFQSAGMQPDLAKWRKYNEIKTRYNARGLPPTEVTYREEEQPRYIPINQKPPYTLLQTPSQVAQSKFSEWYEGLDEYGKKLHDDYLKGYPRAAQELREKLMDFYPTDYDDDEENDYYADPEEAYRNELNIKTLMGRFKKDWDRKFSNEITIQQWWDGKLETTKNIVPKSFDEIFADYPMPQDTIHSLNNLPLPSKVRSGTEKVNVEEKRVLPAARIKPPRLGLKLDAMNDYRKSFEEALKTAYPGVERKEALRRLSADHAVHAARVRNIRSSSVETGINMAKYIFNSSNQKEAGSIDPTNIDWSTLGGMLWHGLKDVGHAAMTPINQVRDIINFGHDGTRGVDALVQLPVEAYGAGLAAEKAIDKYDDAYKLRPEVKEKVKKFKNIMHPSKRDDDDDESNPQVRANKRIASYLAARQKPTCEKCGKKCADEVECKANVDQRRRDQAAEAAFND